jgi:hypothetical protein
MQNNEDTGSTRRDLLRRTAIAGGALWAAPIVLGFGTAAFADPNINCCQFSNPVQACTHQPALPKPECVAIGGLFAANSFCCTTAGGIVSNKCVPNAHPEWCPNGKQGVANTARELEFPVE